MNREPADTVKKERNLPHRSQPTAQPYQAQEKERVCLARRDRTLEETCLLWDRVKIGIGYNARRLTSDGELDHTDNKLAVSIVLRTAVPKIYC